MPDHLRKQIRDATKAALLGTSFAGEDVHIGRVRPIARDQTVILIYTRSETSKRDINGRPPIQERRVRLLIEMRVATAGTPDDDLSAGQVEVEARMAATISLETRRIMGGLLRSLEYVGCEEVVEAVGEKHIGGLQLEYAATYRVAEGVPTAPV
jgi:hypothetical protein